VATLNLASSARASDSTLRTTLHTWSRTIAVDAHSVALAAQNRHPRRMTFSARRFRKDALHAHAAIARQRASSPKGRRAKRLALAAYTDYARAGAGWMTAGRARVAHHRVTAKHAASTAATAARAGSKLLVTAGQMLG
jgi:hypothetical protein